MPPSTFFDRMVNNDDDSEDADDLGDFESVLDVLCSIGLPRKRLRWHYRSRREPLIAFSNHHFYDDDLVTFPSPMISTVPRRFGSCMSLTVAGGPKRDSIPSKRNGQRNSYSNTFSGTGVVR